MWFSEFYQQIVSEGAGSVHPITISCPNFYLCYLFTPAYFHYYQQKSNCCLLVNLTYASNSTVIKIFKSCVSLYLIALGFLNMFNFNIFLLTLVLIPVDAFYLLRRLIKPNNWATLCQSVYQLETKPHFLIVDLQYIFKNNYKLLCVNPTQVQTDERSELYASYWKRCPWLQQCSKNSIMPWMCCVGNDEDLLTSTHRLSELLSD